MNTYASMHVLNELRPEELDDEIGSTIIGTLCPKASQEKPDEIRKILNRAKPKLFKKYLLESNVLVYDLNSGDLNEIEAAVRMLKTENFDDPKTLVVISSIFTWGDTPTKMVPREPGDGYPSTEEEVNEDDEPADPAEEAKEALDKSRDIKTPASKISDSRTDQSKIEGEGEEEEEKPPTPKPIKYKPAPFLEADFATRVSPSKYEQYKTIEDLVLSIKKDNLQGYVISAGVLYGSGERVFSHHFRKAWMEQPKALPYLGEGDNNVPTIHVKDLARFVKYVIEQKPDSKYLLAIDRTRNISQKNLVQAISSGIGSGEIVQIPDDMECDEDVKYAGEVSWKESLSSNIWIKPGQFTQVVQPEADPESEAMPDPVDPVTTFEWQYLQGIPHHIRELNEEFNEQQALKPIKILLMGPPASGKSHFAKQLSEHYNVEVIKVCDVLAQLENSTEESLKEKVKEESENGRVSDATIVELFRWRLQWNHCRNRGYIMDGWPKNYESAKDLFMKLQRPIPEDDEEEIDPNAEDVLRIDEDIFPQSVIVLKANDDALMDRIKELPEAEIKGTHWEPAEMERRCKAYAEGNLDDRVNNTLDFFQENKVEAFEIDAMTEEREIYESMKIYVERNGRPYNYLAAEASVQKKRRDYLFIREAERTAKHNFRLEKEQAIQDEIRNRKEMHALMRFEQFKIQERDIQETRGQPLRQYLMDNIVPILMEGMLEVCKVLPEDPIDYLGEFVFKNSEDMHAPPPPAQ